MMAARALAETPLRTIDLQSTFDKAVAKVATIDLTMVKLKLMDPEEGQGWSQDFADRAEVRYRRFLSMLYVHREGSIVPTKDIDAFWHQHILDTRAYARDCAEVFGEFVHHFPYFGMRGDTDAQNLLSSFETTKQIYTEAFGEPYCLSDDVEGAGKCVKCGQGPTKCHHEPTRCK